MNEAQANALAEIFSGEAWSSGGGTWLAAYWRGDGKYIVSSGDADCEYESEDDVEAGKASNTLVLASGDKESWSSWTRAAMSSTVTPTLRPAGDSARRPSKWRRASSAE